LKKKKHIANWGNFPKIEAEFVAYSQEDNIRETLKKSPTILARGNGRCYGDAALNENIFSSLKLNKFLDFNEKEGVLE